MIPFILCAAAYVVDGDTIHCSAVGRVRLASIDAADKTTSSPCRMHIGDHVCDDVKAAAAKAKLIQLIQGQRITYRIVNYDAKWRRNVAVMRAGKMDLQCAMLKAQQARYLAAYDKLNGYTVLHHCPATVRNALK